MRARTAGSWGEPPSTSALPAVGRRMSSRSRIVVVLPAPLGPMKPKTSPRSTVRSSSSTAVSDPKRFVSPTVSTTDALMGTAAADA